MGRVGPDAESRKVVTVLFCDVVGSTSITEGDPEVARRVITDYFEVLRDVVVRHGGTVEKFIGDEVMAVYGVPQTHEDDALRAARTAVEIREAVASLGTRLSIRVGINTGEVVAGDHSAGHGFLTGDAVVVGKRLAESASRGEILMGDATFALVRDAVVAEDPAELQLKGKSVPVGARRLLAVLADAPGVRRRPGATLVGRERELALLRHAFEGAAAYSRGHLFTVLGPAGVGKSRLVRELVADVGDRATVLGGRCLAYGEGITYWPLLDVVRQAAAIPPHVGPDEARARIARLLGDHREVDAIASFVAGAVGLTDTPASTQETFWAFRELLETIALECPLVLVFDDLHWAERTFLDLVEQLGDATRDQPILIVCLSRPELLELRPAWGGGYVNASSVLIEPLAREEAARLIDGLADGSLDEDTRQTIIGAAEGNPLFIEEMVAVAREGGAVSVTPTIQALLATRLDHLPREERAAIEAAAVAGQSFNGRAVLALTGDEAVAGRLESLARKELVRQQRDSSPQDPWFRFRHILIRDAAYDAMPKARRSQLHEQFADWLERDMGDRVREVEEILGYHLERATLLRREIGLPADTRVAARAGRLLSAAAQRAFARDDLHAARSLHERAVALLPEGEASRFESQYELSVIDWLGGRFEEAAQRTSEVIDGAAAAGRPELAWYARLAQAARVEQDPEHVADDAIDALSRLGDARGLARAWRLKCLAAESKGRNGEAETYARRGLEHALSSGDGPEIARLADRLATTLYYGPAPAAAAIADCERLLDQADGRPLMQANVLCSLGGLVGMVGRVEETRVLCERARTTYEELGFELLVAGAYEMQAAVAALAEDDAGAEQAYRKAYEIVGERGGLNSYYRARLASALVRLGRVDEAAGLVPDREALGDEVPVRITGLTASSAVKSALREADGALADAEEAVELATGTDLLNLHAEACERLAEELERAGRARESRDALSEALALVELKGNVLAAERLKALLRSTRV